MTTTHHEALLQSLRFRYEGSPEDSVLTVHQFVGQRFTTKTFALRDLTRIAEMYAGSEDDTWSRVSVISSSTILKEHSRGAETDTYGTQLCHVDIDPPDGVTDLLSWQEQTLDKLQRFTPAVSAIEFSGRGFYAFWKIPWTEDWQRVKRVNKWLGLQLDGDDCFDVARILRLPGTKNTKPDAQWASGYQYTRRVHSLDDFGEAELTPLERGDILSDLQPGPLPLGFEGQLQAEHPKLWARIWTEDSAREAGAALKHGGRVDRSANDFYIANELLRLKLGPDAIYTVLTHPTWFSGSKFRTTGYRDSYVIQTTAQAVSVFSEQPMTNVADMGRKLLAEHHLLKHLGNWYHYDPDQGYYARADHFIDLAIQAMMQDKWKSEAPEAVRRYLTPHVEFNSLPPTGLVNVQNGMLDLSTGELTVHTAAYRTLFQINARWDPDADTKAVDEFVAQILPDDAIDTWWRFCGYCLLTDLPLPYRAILALVGPRRTGKSTLLKAMEFFLGPQNCSAVSMDDLTGSGNQFTTASMVGKLLNIDGDAAYEKPVRKINLLKKIASGDTITIEQKFEKGGEGVLFCKLAFAMNDVPRVGVTDEAFYDRWLVIPVRQDHRKFTPENAETRLNAHMALLAPVQNRSAWLKRSVEGWQSLVKAGQFGTETSLKDAKNDFRQRSDSVYGFWLECTGEDAELRKIPLSSFYVPYQAWTSECGMAPVNKWTFCNRSKELAVEGLIPGLELKKWDQWVCRGRKVTYGQIRVRGQ